MRRAKIRKRHVLRAVVFGCDFGFIALLLIFIGRDEPGSSEFALLVAFVCAAISLYRLYFAYSRYLRFHLPFVTVLVSQVMVFMLMSIVYLQLWTPW
jgi:FtsH-binding integral membrane protein